MSDRNSNSVEIKCVDVDKTYRMGEVDVPVLKKINVEIPHGEMTAVLGASGSGKSTLLNIIGGLDRPTSGEVWSGGQDLAGLDDRELTLYRRENVGFVFQFYNLVPTLTARENVEVSTQIADDPMDPLEALHLVGLEDWAGYFPSQMSGGQQQRVSIARALAKKPRVMLCDEPTGALDFKTGRTILSLLTGLNDQMDTTIVMVTHAAPISNLARRVIHITHEGITTRENSEPARAEDIKW